MITNTYVSTYVIIYKYKVIMFVNDGYMHCNIFNNENKCPNTYVHSQQQ